MSGKQGFPSASLRLCRFPRGPFVNKADWLEVLLLRTFKLYVSFIFCWGMKNIFDISVMNPLRGQDGGRIQQLCTIISCQMWTGSKPKTHLGSWGMSTGTWGKQKEREEEKSAGGCVVKHPHGHIFMHVCPVPWCEQILPSPWWAFL